MDRLSTSQKGIKMNEAIQNAARLLDVSVESLLNFSQDTLNAMEAIMLMYDLKEEKTVMQAYKELDKLWRKKFCKML